MPWIRLDDGFYNNPTNRRLGPAGRDLFVASLAWCTQGLTDGRIDRADIKALLTSAQSSDKVARKLIENGRWIDHETHIEVVDYLRYQPSKAKVLSDREAAAQRQRRAREKADRHGVTNGVTNGVSHSVSHAPPDPTRPLIGGCSSSSPGTTTTQPQDDVAVAAGKPSLAIDPSQLDQLRAARGQVFGA